MDRTLEIWITQVLTNDEVSTDAELLELFEQEGKLSHEDAVWWIEQRDRYIGQLFPKPMGYKCRV
jgi:hypothetical protein